MMSRHLSHQWFQRSIQVRMAGVEYKNLFTFKDSTATCTPQHFLRSIDASFAPRCSISRYVTADLPCCSTKEHVRHHLASGEADLTLSRPSRGSKIKRLKRHHYRIIESLRITLTQISQIHLAILDRPADYHTFSSSLSAMQCNESICGSSTQRIQGTHA